MGCRCFVVLRLHSYKHMGAGGAGNMVTRLLYATLFTAVLLGGVFYGATRILTDTGPDW